MAFYYGERKVEQPEGLKIYQALRTLREAKEKYGELKCCKPMLDELKEIVNNIEEVN